MHPAQRFAADKPFQRLHPQSEFPQGQRTLGVQAPGVGDRAEWRLIKEIWQKIKQALGTGHLSLCEDEVDGD